jgi:anaerobic magnesium-protoporphyrin IX monomethyl ester cyclase
MVAIDTQKRVAFIQTVPFELVGIQMLAAVLKKHHLQVIITYIDPYERIREKIREFNPDFLCFTACTGDHEVLLQIAGRLKEEFKVPFIWGGPHPTFFPEIINEEGVDVVVRGEAEIILPRIIDFSDDTTVESCWFKAADGSIIRNKMGRLIKDLDELPFPDRSLYRKHYKSLPNSSLNILAGRGCPFDCRFCYNQALKGMFKEDYLSGSYVRLRSPQNVIAEIEEYMEKYGRPRFVHFRDDTFIFNRRWLEKFLGLYEERIGIPFTCLGRADLIDDEMAVLLKRAGLVMFCWAVESGSERLRNNVCGKGITDEQILRCGLILNRYKIPSRVYNMMGLPSETYEDAKLTVTMNQRIGNRFPLSTVYEPYPNTKMEEMARREGLLLDLTGQRSRTQYDGAYVKGDDRIMRIHKLFFWLVLFPSLDKWGYRYIQKDHKLINKVMFYIGYAYVFHWSYKYTIVEMALIVWRLFKPLATFKI